MRRVVTMLAVLVIPTLSGCGSLLSKWEDDNSFEVAADSIDPTINGKYSDPFAASNDTKDYVGQVVNDSVQKCGKFLNGLVIASNSVNTSLDMSTTVFSALATAFTPVATIHALTAGATISSGWKTAINSDMYAKATIANYAQAIQALYYTEINSYMTALTTMQDSQVKASLEVAKLRIIHKDCSLASAQSTISATLQAPASQQASTNKTDTWLVTDAFKTGDTITMTATSTSFSNGSVDISIVVKKNEKKSDVVVDLIQAIGNAYNQNADVQKAGIGASHGSDSATIILTALQSAGVVWSSSSSALQHQNSSTSNPGNASNPSNASSSPNSNVTTGGHPGASLNSLPKN